MRFSELDAALAALEEKGLARPRTVIESAQGTRPVVGGRQYLSFAGNDYLGLANHPALKMAAAAAVERFGVGAGASQLLTGCHHLHRDLEDAFAVFVGAEAALLFPSGYSANLAVVASLAERGGVVIQDRLNHASLIDAAILSRATLRRYPHRDLDALARELAAAGDRPKLVASEAVFSMDGDEADLPALVELCDRFDAWLLIDDAHGFGVTGEGRGALSAAGVASPRLIYMATLGKAAGVSGALVAGGAKLMSWLSQVARTFIFTTAPPPALAAAALAALDLIGAGHGLRALLRANIARLRQGLGGALLPSSTPIQPLVVGGNDATMGLAARLREGGILVGAVRPPTVPPGQARLRLSLSAAHSEVDIDRLVAALGALPL